MTQPPHGDPGNPWQTPPSGPPREPVPVAAQQPQPQPVPVAPAPAPPQHTSPQHPPPQHPPAQHPPPQHPPAQHTPPQHPPAQPQPGWTPPTWPATDQQPPAPPGWGPMPPPPMSGPLSAPPYPGFGPPPRKGRTGLWVTLIVLALVLVLGGGGAAAYVLTRDSDGIGRATAQDAVEAFLRAMYVDQNATKVAPLVCKAARGPRKIAAKVDEIKHQDQQYDSPKYTWSYVDTQHPTDTRAVISTKITLSTDDVQTATQTLKVTAIRSNGWFVCDVAAA